jgi:hypothetical protein
MATILAHLEVHPGKEDEWEAIMAGRAGLAL